MIRSSVLVAAFALAACAPSSATAPLAEQWRAVEVTATPVNFGAEQVGRLRFRGGLDLRGDDAAFGGLSGLEVLDDGRLIAISDNGDWFEGRLALDASGALVGVENMRTAMMRDENGDIFPNKRAGDSEGLTQLIDGRFAVSFEQTQTIRIYNLNRDGPFGVAQLGPVLDRVARLPRNAGLEALATTSEGDLVIGAEGGDRATTPLWRASLSEPGPVAPLTGYPTAPGFSLTSLDRTPAGAFVALERFYAPVIGARARITLFAAEALDTRAATLEHVQELAMLGPPLALDNFEGIAATLMPDGTTRIYIVSDNNFSARQRTLLLAFDVVEAN
ncbi:MAG: esterase-like activity of phytase family protein [Hyphomonadaceae bacterium]